MTTKKEEDRESAMIRTEEQQNRKIIMDSAEQAEDKEDESAPHYPDTVQLIPIEPVGRKEENKISGTIQNCRI